MRRYAKMGIPMPEKPKEEETPKALTPEEMYADDPEREMAIACGWDF